MKYKTLIEKNSEPNLTEGRLTGGGGGGAVSRPPPPPPHPRFASTTLLPAPNSRYRLPTRQIKGAFTLAKKIAGSLKKTHAQRMQACGAKTCE